MQLLKTKFHIPEFKPDKTLSRKKISGLIDASESIITVAAPAGFGKTTLLSEWAERSPSRIAWVSLEKSEDIPAVFWCYIITAISSVADNCGNKAIELINTSDISIENILIGLINELTESKANFSLVLDDYHIITDTNIHNSLEFFIDHLPSNVRIIIAGREKPQIPLSKLRLSGRLTEINASQLRFNTEDAGSMLNSIHRLNLGPDVIRSLNKKTEGWAAGLALAVLSIRDNENIDTFINDFTGSHRYIIDYLIEEVLSGLDDETRDFMLISSVPERFCSDLCVTLTDNKNSGSILDEIVQNNLFIVPLDNHKSWYRYHHLFREFLLKNLTGQSPGMIKSYHEKAFIWFKENGFDNDAFNHCINAEDYRKASEFLSEKASELFTDSGGFILANMIKQLPETDVNNAPDLCCYKVMLDALSGDFSAMELLYQTHFDDNLSVKGYRALIEGYQCFYQTGEFAKCIEITKQALILLPAGHKAAIEMGELILGLAYRYSGDILSAYNQLKHNEDDKNPPVLGTINYADIMVGMGQLAAPYKLICATLETSRKKYGENLPAEYGYLYIQKANILREKNDIEAALKACRNGLNLARKNEYIELIFLGNLEYARVLAADKNFTESKKMINRSLKAAQAGSAWGAFMTMAYKARIEIFKGNIEAAENFLNGTADFSAKEIPFYQYHQFLTYCRLCILKKEISRVHEITDFMIKEDLLANRFARLLECYILKATAYYAANDIENAVDTLKKAFKISSPEGHTRLYIDEGQPMIELFRSCEKQRILPDYLTPYLKKSSSPESGKSKDIIVIINEFKERFNDREIEILKLMKDGCSNKDISNKLFISVNTVRWYASRIFAKLDARRRGEAVSYAEKYQLI